MNRRRLTLVLGCSFALVLAALSAADARGFRRSIELQRQIGQVKARNEQLTRDNAALVQEIHGLRKDPAALERAAREELGFVKPGEVVITLEAP